MHDTIVGEKVLYEYAVRPLPILELRKEDFGATSNIKIGSFIVGLEGSASFKYQIIESLSLDSDPVEGNFRQHDEENTDDDYFSGQVWVNNLDANGSILPELRIIKRDDRFIKINSINFQTGG